MIILEKPYVSEFLIDSIVQNDFAVLENDLVMNSGIEDGAFNLVKPQNAKNYYMAQEFPLIYGNSENAITWVLENIPKSNLSDYIRLFKDKILFRETLSSLFPDFYFQGVDYNELKNLELTKIKFPIILKPAVGFLSFGVHLVNNKNEWKDVLETIEKEMRHAENLYPDSVVSSAKFILEEYVEGEEYAVDAYYDRNGEPVILNIFHHPLHNSSDVGNRMYLMSTGIMIKYMAKIAILLREIGNLKNIRNFPLHLELRVTNDGVIMPIEVNPMRFSSWCTTDVAKYAWGINVYEHFFNQTRPDWNRILEKSGKGAFYFSLVEVPKGTRKKEINGFDYEKYLANYSNVLEVRRIEPKENPLFAIIFGFTADKDEVKKILSLNTKSFML